MNITLAYTKHYETMRRVKYYCHFFIPFTKKTRPAHSHNKKEKLCFNFLFENIFLLSILSCTNIFHTMKGMH